MKLIIDASSLLWQSLLAGKDTEFGKEVEHEGRKHWVNGWQFGLECAESHLRTVMEQLEVVPQQLIFVVEGGHSKAPRQAIYPQYKMTRSSRPDESYEEFGLCKDALLAQYFALGAQGVTQNGVEADDVIAYLARKLGEDLVILSRDGDLATLITDKVSLYRQGSGIVRENLYGPFPCRFIPIFKALCGDGSEYKGAARFGPKKFLALLECWGIGGLAALEGMIKRGTLADLEENVEEFPPFRLIIDSAEHVTQSYQCALLHDEWVDTPSKPLSYLAAPLAGQRPQAAWWEKLHPAPPPPPERHAVFDCELIGSERHAVFDCELIGSERPVFLMCAKVIETGETASFWQHKAGHMMRMKTMMQREDLTWVSFNGIGFDAPLISAAIDGKPPKTLKQISQDIIVEGERHWDMPKKYGYTPFDFDHIDLIEVAPGVKISLKAYAGRMSYPTMVDLPFPHDVDLEEDQLETLETYCKNDLGVTQALFERLREVIDLRKELTAEHGIDLRSKSDAQAAEALLKKAAGVGKRGGETPPSVLYTAPPFIDTDSDDLNVLIERLNNTSFPVNAANGQVESPDFLKDPLPLGEGTYQFGIGGLHSTHDNRLYVEASDGMLISDFDVASYYPTLMLKAGFTPRLEGEGGANFIEAYRHIYETRQRAKREGHKKISDALKIQLNGIFGKLGSPYSAFYAPDLMLAVTLTGQLNLACLIYALECKPSIKVLSANTDGIAVSYPASERSRVLAIIARNAARTGFEYEETRYSKIALKDVNNYIALTTDGKVKRKGLYAKISLMKNPSMSVCSDLAVRYLKEGVLPEEAIDQHTDIRDYVAVRSVKGGGVQSEEVVEVDDWVEARPREWVRQAWIDSGTERAPVKRKSRPAPVSLGVGGTPFGRIARWYMSTSSLQPISYVGSGNKVPKTDGARLCMTLPDRLPDDLDKEWYIRETRSILSDIGVSSLDTLAAIAH